MQTEIQMTLSTMCFIFSTARPRVGTKKEKFSIERASALPSYRRIGWECSTKERLGDFGWMDSLQEPSVFWPGRKLVFKRPLSELPFAGETPQVSSVYNLGS